MHTEKTFGDTWSNIMGIWKGKVLLHFILWCHRLSYLLTIDTWLMPNAFLMCGVFVCVCVCVYVYVCLFLWVLGHEFSSYHSVMLGQIPHIYNCAKVSILLSCEPLSMILFRYLLYLPDSSRYIIWTRLHVCVSVCVSVCVCVCVCVFECVCKCVCVCVWACV